jgi:hypothetical protein
VNRARRQLTTEQKRELIADQLREAPERTDRWIGKMLGIHHSERFGLFGTKAAGESRALNGPYPSVSYQSTFTKNLKFLVGSSGGVAIPFRGGKVESGLYRST